MLVADFVESHFSYCQEYFIDYSNRFSSSDFHFESLLTMVDRLDVECEILLDLARSCCSEYPDLVRVCHQLSDDVSELESEIIKSHYKGFLHKR